MCNPNASKCQISSSTRPSSRPGGCRPSVWSPQPTSGSRNVSKCSPQGFLLLDKIQPTNNNYGFPQMLPCSHPAFFLHVPDIAIIRCNLQPTPVWSCQCHQNHSLTVGPDNIHCPLTQTTKYRTIVFGVSNFQGQGHGGSNDPAPQLQ